MSHNDTGSDQKARVRAHVRAVVSRLVRAQQAGGKPANSAEGSVQQRVKADREQDGS